MAKQKGIIKLAGSIEDISFYKSRDGYIARARGGISKGRMATDPAFQRVRENNAEFGRAGAAGRLIRTALRPLLRRTADGRVTSRLTTELLRVVKLDPVNIRGQRTVTEGPLEMMKDFEFNSSAVLGATFNSPFDASIDRVTGEATVSLPEFVPDKTISVPPGATHLKLSAAGAEIDFILGSFKMEIAETVEIPVGPQVEEAVDLTVALPAASVASLLLVLGIEFYQEVNGQFYPMSNGEFNALSIVAVDGKA